MSESFEKWKATYNCDEDTIQGYNIRDMQAAYTAGLERAAEIAEDMEGSWADLEWNQVCRDIAAAIRKEAGNDHRRD